MFRSLLLAALSVTLVALVGCESQGTIRAAEVDVPMRNVVSRHDAYVSQDENLTEVERSTFLRSSEIILNILDEAKPKIPTPGG